MLIPISVLAIFFCTSILLALAPGPDNIFVLTQSAMRGRIAGWAITLGLCTGLIGHTIVVASSIAVILQTSYIAYASLKLAGVTYLLYLAYLAFQASSITLNKSNNITDSLSQLYRRGILMNVTNPKVSIFFLSFLPQFTDSSRGSLLLQILILGFIFIIAAMLVFGIISLLAGFIGEQFMSSSRIQILMNRITGTIYFSMALKIAIESI